LIQRQVLSAVIVSDFSRRVPSIDSMADNGLVSAQTTVGFAYVDGKRLARVELHETWIVEWVPVPIPGTNRTDRKDLSHPGPASLRFSDVEDQEFRGRLATLVEFATAGVDRQRAIRDAGLRSVAVDLALDGGRQVSGAVVQAPLVGTGSVESAMFSVALPG
jgi:hypothetical protein